MEEMASLVKKYDHGPAEMIYVEFVVNYGKSVPLR
jgi:hypothetical protein